MLLQEQSMTLMAKARMSYHSVLVTFFGLLPRANSLASEDGFSARSMGSSEGIVPANYVKVSSLSLKPLTHKSNKYQNSRKFPNLIL